MMKIVVVGHGMVGHKYLKCLAEAGLSAAEVTVLAEEPPAGDRVHLSEFFFRAHGRAALRWSSRASSSAAASACVWRAARRLWTGPPGR